jgi:large subunit ribosomal protein L13
MEKKWLLVDATDKSAGRLASSIAQILRGKDKPTYTPHLDTGDFVVVINADKVKLTGGKETKKIYKDYTGYPNGLKQVTAARVRATNPTRIITQAVRGMLPHNRLGRQLFTKLKVYAGSEHPHAAQQPVAVDL